MLLMCCMSLNSKGAVLVTDTVTHAPANTLDSLQALPPHHTPMNAMAGPRRYRGAMPAARSYTRRTTHATMVDQGATSKGANRLVCARSTFRPEGILANRRNSLKTKRLERFSQVNITCHIGLCPIFEQKGQEQGRNRERFARRPHERAPFDASNPAQRGDRRANRAATA